MDYHLDWLYAALTLAAAKDHGVCFPSPAFPRADGTTYNVNSNQEDIDLLLAFDIAATSHLVLIEAKGSTSWTTKQFSSKVRRLRHIFGDDGTRFASIRPHFALASPRESVGLKSALGDLPAWMRPSGKLLWLELSMPPHRLATTRCDAEGHRCRHGDRWKLA